MRSWRIYKSFPQSHPRFIITKQVLHAYNSTSNRADFAYPRPQVRAQICRTTDLSVCHLNNQGMNWSSWRILLNAPPPPPSLKLHDKVISSRNLCDARAAAPSTPVCVTAERIRRDSRVNDGPWKIFSLFHRALSGEHKLTSRRLSSLRYFPFRAPCYQWVFQM